MKKVVFMSIIASVLSLFGCSTAKEQQMPSGRLVSFSYMYQTTTWPPVWDIEAELDSANEVSLMVSHEDDTSKVVVGREVLDHVKEMMCREKVDEWKKRYQPSMNVLDGDSWSYSASFEDGGRLSSGGANAGPKSNAMEQIRDYLFNQAKSPK